MTPQTPPKLTSTFDYLAQTRGHQSLISTRFILQTKQPFDEADLDDKILLYRVGLSDTDQAKTCTLGNVFVDLALALHIRFLQAGIMEDLDEAVSLAREVLLAHPTDHPGHLAFTINLGIILSTRSHQTGRSPDIMEAVSLLWQAVNSMGDGSDDDPLLLHELAFALRNRLKWRAAMWDVQGVPAGGEDISDAVSLHRRALNHTTTPAHRILSLNYLALALRTQALTHEHNNNAQQSSLALIDEAVALLRESVTISCAAPFTLRELATSLDARFSQTHALGDLNEAISLHRLSLDHLDEKHPRLSAILTSLVAALHRRYAETQDRQDFIDAVSLHHRVRLLHPKRHAGSSYAFAVLGPVLCPKIRQNTPIPHLPDTQSRGPIVSALPELRVLAEAASASESDDEEDSGRAELDHKISVLRKRISLNKTGDRAATLTELAIAVQARFTMQQERDFLDWDDSGITEAISLYEKALKLRAPPHPERASSLGNLALAKYVLYMQTNDMPDTSSLLDQVISLLRSALDLRPPTHPERSSTLNHLAVALHTRHEHAGRLVDLDESILLHREALVCCSETTTNDRATSLIGLAVALQARSEQLRQASSMDEAINLLEEALALHEVGSSRDHGYASLKLALALQSRYQQNGRLPDLRRATEVYHVGLSNLQHDQSSNSHLIGLMLSGLATALRTLFGITHAITELEMAIELHSKALELLPENHHDTILCLNRLADAQYTMAETTGRADDLNEAISLCTDALRQFGRDNSDSAIRCPTLEILGRAFLLRFLRADELGDDWKDLFGAGKAFQEIAACPSAPLSQRFSAARMCARISDARDDGHGLALRGYSATVDLLPLLAGVATDLETRQRVVNSDTDGLAREAAACAIRHGQLDKAVEFLEAGRAVFWLQSLQLRTPVDKLESVRPDLAERLREITRLLSTSGSASGSSGSYDEQTIRYRQLSAQWRKTVAEVQDIDGLEGFMENKSFDELRAAGQSGPVVILNASHFRSECDALVVTNESGPLHVRLSHLSYQKVDVLARRMKVVLLGATRDSRSSAPYYGFKDADAAFSNISATLWKFVVQPIFHALNLKPSNQPPRLWWMPTGPFAFLPIHAAGIYDGPNCQWVADYVVSSYTPTLSALLIPPPSTHPFKILAVIQPHSPGQRPLPSTREELSRIEKHVPSEHLIKYGIPEAPAYAEDILSALPVVSIAHFACHGVQHQDRPLESALLLERPLRISELMALDMPNATLAFLSACQTAASNEQLPDEPMHLAATMLFAGFRGVVATLWSIYDVDGPTVAGHFYQYISSNGGGSTDDSKIFDTALSAEALHFAVKRLRTETTSFTRWVPFVHIGV